MISKGSNPLGRMARSVYEAEKQAGYNSSFTKKFKCDLTFGIPRCGFALNGNVRAWLQVEIFAGQMVCSPLSSRWPAKATFVGPLLEASPSIG